MAVADDEKRSDVLEDANKIEVSFEPSEFGSSSPLTKVADPGSPGKNLNTCTVSLTTLEPGFPCRPVQSTSAGITLSCVGTQEYKHVVSKSRTVVAEHDYYRSDVKSLHSTFSIANDKNSLKSSPDERCSNENAAELPEVTLYEPEIPNDMTDIAQAEEVKTDDGIKDLEKDGTENMPQEVTSTGEDEPEIPNYITDIAQGEELKTEEGIKDLEKDETENMPHEGTSTGEDEPEIPNDMTNNAEAEEVKTEDGIKDLKKDGTENMSQEGTSTGEDGQWIFVVILALILFGNVCKCTEMSLERDKVDVYLVNENSIRVIVKTNDTNKTTKWMMTRDRKSDTLVFQNKVNPNFMGKVKWENDTSILINDLTYEDWNSYLSFIKGFDSSITKKLKEYVEPVCPNNLSVVDSLETNVTVMWYFGLSRGHQLVTYLQYKMNESSEWLLVANMSEQSNQKNKKIIIADLIAETLYNLRLFTVDMDYSGFVCKNLTTSTKTVKQEPQLKKPDNKPMMQSILEGICACLSVATIIGVLVLLIRLRKHLLYIVKKKAASNGQTNKLLAKYKPNEHDEKKMVEVVHVV